VIYRSALQQGWRPPPGYLEYYGGASKKPAEAQAPEQEPTALVQRASHDPGAPVDAGIRERVEAATRADLGGVRVHTGAGSQEAAEALTAQAFTVGQDIHFSQGAYQPGTREGDRLIAHELVHTVQQGPEAVSPQYKLEVSEPGDAAELEADRIADAVVAGGTVGGSVDRPAAQPVRAARKALMRDKKEGPAAPPKEAKTQAGTEGGAAGACSEEELKKKEAFKKRKDLALTNHIPSTGLGKFDAAYHPDTGILDVTVKIHFDFVKADDTPGF
jgi:hypothetical protein